MGTCYSDVTMTTSFHANKKLVLLSVLSFSMLVAGCSSVEAPSDEEDVDEMVEVTVPVPAVPPAAPVQEVATCGEKNAECDTSDDCCGNMGLECKPVQTSSGLSKRCLPVEVMVCRSDCAGGVWGKMQSCKPMVAPKNMPKCQDFIGDSCVTSVNNHRNDRECTDT